MRYNILNLIISIFEDWAISRKNLLSIDKPSSFIYHADSLLHTVFASLKIWTEEEALPCPFFFVGGIDGNSD